MYDLSGNLITMHIELLYVLLTARILFDFNYQFGVILMNFLRKAGRK